MQSAQECTGRSWRHIADNFSYANGYVFIVRCSVEVRYPEAVSRGREPVEGQLL